MIAFSWGTQFAGSRFASVRSLKSEMHAHGLLVKDSVRLRRLVQWESLKGPGHAAGSNGAETVPSRLRRGRKSGALQ